jgi:hypothetical protein
MAELNVFSQIDDRLRKLSPPILIERHIAADKNGDSTLKAFNTVLDGINFKAKNRKDLEDALSKTRDPATGERAFAGTSHEDQSHWGLKLSFAATNGTGMREIWRFPSLSAGPLTRNSMFDDNFSGNFGTSMSLPDITSLHCAITDDVCNIHIDRTGFVLESPMGGMALTPDFVNHILDELVLKTKLKGVAPAWAKSAIDRLSLIYFSSGNNYDRAGPRINQVPLLNNLSRIPTVGGVLGKVPLPGLSVDLIQGQNYTLKVMATCGVHGDCSATVNIGGTFGSRK